jgi:hypothetical protein
MIEIELSGYEAVELRKRGLIPRGRRLTPVDAAYDEYVITMSIEDALVAWKAAYRDGANDALGAASLSIAAAIPWDSLEGGRSRT